MPNGNIFLNSASNGHQFGHVMETIKSILIENKRLILFLILTGITFDI